MGKTLPSPRPYSLQFSDTEWDELESLSFTNFEVRKGRLLRGQWVALGYMALGKAQRIDSGALGGPEDDEVDVVQWAEDLRGIAEKIFDFFQPGDGKI